MYEVHLQVADFVQNLNHCQYIFINIEPKLLNYRDYKDFNFGNFKEDLCEAFSICRNSHDEFESAFLTALDKHAPKKKKWLMGNNKPHITKLLRRAIMKWSKLKNKTNQTKILTDIRKYKKQAKLCSESKQKHKMWVL